MQCSPPASTTVKTNRLPIDGEAYLTHWRPGEYNTMHIHPYISRITARLQVFRVNPPTIYPCAVQNIQHVTLITDPHRYRDSIHRTHEKHLRGNKRSACSMDDIHIPLDSIHGTTPQWGSILAFLITHPTRFRAREQRCNQTAIEWITTLGGAGMIATGMGHRARPWVSVHGDQLACAGANAGEGRVVMIG